MTIELEFRRLAERDRLVLFDAGPDHEALTRFFRESAGQAMRRGLSVTWVATAGETLAGFCTIFPGSLAPEQAAGLVKGASRHVPLPVLFLGQMATLVTLRGQGVGASMMRGIAFREALALRDTLGCGGLCLDALESAEGFYVKLGLVAIGSKTERGTTPMFISTARIEASTL